jgi:ATP-dependent Lon protease
MFTGKIGVYKFEIQIISVSGKYEKSGTSSSSQAKESIKTAFNVFKANAKSVSQSISVKEKDYFLHTQYLYGLEMSEELSVAAFISLCSGAIERLLQEQTAVLGSMTIGGCAGVLENLAGLLQVCLDAGSKRVLIPIASAGKIATVPPDLFSKFQISFYEDPIDAVYKSMALI